MDQESKPPSEGADSDNTILDPLPKTYGELLQLLQQKGEFNPYKFRLAA